MLRGIAVESPNARHTNGGVRDPAGDHADELLSCDDVIMLDHEDRFRRRIVLTAQSGTQFLLDLERPVRLRQGDLIHLDDGRRVRVEAAPQELAEIRPSRNAPLAMIAYHLGNRHIEAQLFDNRVRICRDHVIEDMLRRLGADVRIVVAPFEPLPGAAAHDHEAPPGTAS